MLILETEQIEKRRNYVVQALTKIEQLKDVSLTMSNFKVVPFDQPWDDPLHQKLFLDTTFKFTHYSGIFEMFRLLIPDDIFDEYRKENDPQLQFNVSIDQLISIRLTKLIFDTWKQIMKDRGYKPENLTNSVTVRVNPDCIDSTLTGTFNTLSIGPVNVNKMDQIQDAIYDARQEFTDKLQKVEDERDALQSEVDRLKNLTDLLITKCQEKGIL